MKVEVKDSVLRLACGISGGAVDVSKLVLLGVGTLLIQPSNDVKALGELVHISYKNKDGVFTHQFSEPRPILAHSLTSLFILNGEFNIGERGIVEKKDFEKNHKK